MTKDTTWRQVTITDSKTGKKTLVGVIKLEIKSTYIPLSELTIDKLILKI